MFRVDYPMIISNYSTIQSHTFGKNPEGELRRVQHGIPAKVTAEYTGYTGPKELDFPTNPHLNPEKYPDVTKQYNELLESLLNTANEKNGKSKIINFFKKCSALGKNFKTGDKWDTKFLENFPGRDINGKVQYARLNDKIVSANYVSNHIYGESLAKLGFKRWFVILASHLDAAGLSNLIFEGQLPTLKNLKFKDTDADQKTIRFAFDQTKESLTDTSKKIGNQISEILPNRLIKFA
ncbi:MAG: hypothetical protein PHE78_04390 [Candidatus Gastranaerophilales bacterium]|nr:hypothetical protein [Candidatus Gastranaerophilales bacterium]